MRRIFLEQLNGESIENILQTLKNYAQENSDFGNHYQYIESLISGEIFNVKEALKAKIEHDVEFIFNYKINCGGYALKVDTCIMPDSRDFEKSVTTILKMFPFVRLLEDTELKEDEYLVLYRHSKGRGHHFIRIEDDGTVVEKHDCKPPQKFQGWGDLEECPEAVFAVKKEHEIEYRKKYGYIGIPDETVMNFEETVWNTIKQKQNIFEYRDHNYSLKKSGEGTIYVCSDTDIVAEMIIEGEEYDIEIKEGKQAYISNTQPLKPIVIKDGHYQKDKQQYELE